jgi:hypothetical protein
MSEYDDDIDFDFFGPSKPEPPKRRLVRRPSGPPPPGGTPPPRRPAAPPPSATPIIRLVSLIVFAIAMILILVFAVRSCEASNESSAYKDYMNAVTPIATDSQAVGTQLNNQFANQNLTEAQLETKLTGLARQQDIDLANASKLTPPGPLRQQQEKIIEALQLRSDALKGLLNVFKATATKRGTSEVQKAGQLLATEMYKAVASDVIWAELFEKPARQILQDEGVAGVSPPASVFVADPYTATRQSMGAVWQQIHGVTPTENPGAGRHGTGIAYVKVYPSGQTLSEYTTTTIKVQSGLTFEVGVENTGDYLEQNVKVTLVINQIPSSSSVTRKQTILKIYNGSTEKVDFKGPFTLVTMITAVPINVDVQPVTGEANLANNSRTYKVRFTF